MASLSKSLHCRGTVHPRHEDGVGRQSLKRLLPVARLADVCWLPHDRLFPCLHNGLRPYFTMPLGRELPVGRCISSTKFVLHVASDRFSRVPAWENEQR